MNKRRFLACFGTLFLKKGHLSLEMVFFLCLFVGGLFLCGIYVYLSPSEVSEVKTHQQQEISPDNFDAETDTDDLETSIMSVRTAIRPYPLRDPFQGSLSEADINNLMKKAEAIEKTKPLLLSEDERQPDEWQPKEGVRQSQRRNHDSNSVFTSEAKEDNRHIHSQRIALEGVILGKEKLAMLTIGGENVSLMEGESSHNLQVQQITESGVSIIEGGVTKWLTVP